MPRWHPNPSDDTSAYVTIRFADGTVEVTGMLNMIAMGDIRSGAWLSARRESQRASELVAIAQAEPLNTTF
jgi:hypothetical protein